MNEILNHITTTKERDELLSFLDLLKGKAFDPGLNLNEFINLACPQKYIGLVKQIFTGGSGSVQSEQILTKVKEIEEKLKSLPHVTLTLAHEPDQSSIDIVERFFRQTLERPVVIEFIKDPTIIGGSVIESNGYVFEYSFRDYFEKKRGFNLGNLNEKRQDVLEIPDAQRRVKNGF